MRNKNVFASRLPPSRSLTLTHFPARRGASRRSGPTAGQTSELATDGSAAAGGRFAADCPLHPDKITNREDSADDSLLKSMEHGHVEDVGASNVGTLLACTWCGPTALFCVVLFQWASMIPPSQLRASPHEHGHIPNFIFFTATARSHRAVRHVPND